MAEAATIEDQNEPIDGTPEDGQPYRTGSIPEGELELARSVAKRLGWTPKEEWKRDPSKWTDAPEFLEQTPRQIESLKERVKRTGQAAADAIEDARRQARIEAHAEIRAAAKSGDEEAAAAAADKLARVSGPPAETVAWIARNAWFNEDEDARVLAVNEINRLAAQNLSIPDQLEAAEAKVRKRFPEHFDPPPQREEIRETRKPPAVTGGSRGTGAAPKEKGFGDIPGADRQQYQRYFAKRFESQGLTPEQAQAKYAKSYWSNKGD